MLRCYQDSCYELCLCFSCDDLLFLSRLSTLNPDMGSGLEFLALVFGWSFLVWA